jgi:protein JSN1
MAAAAALQMFGQNPQSGPPQLSIDPAYGSQSVPQRNRSTNAVSTFPPSTDHFNPFARSSESSSPRIPQRRIGGPTPPATSSTIPMPTIPYGAQSPVLGSGAILGMGQPSYNNIGPQSVPPQVYQQYMYQMYQQNTPNMGTFHA